MGTRSTKRILVWIGLGTLAMGVVGAIITAAVLYFSAGMRDVTHQFLAAVRFGRPDLAYPLTSARLRTQVPPTAFPAWLERVTPQIRTSQGEWINGFSGGGGRECMDVWLDYGTIFHGQLYVLIVKENDTWRVDDVSRTSDFPECSMGGID